MGVLTALGAAQSCGSEVLSEAVPPALQNLLLMLHDRVSAGFRSHGNCNGGWAVERRAIMVIMLAVMVGGAIGWIGVLSASGAAQNCWLQVLSEAMLPALQNLRRMLHDRVSGSGPGLVKVGRVMWLRTGRGCKAGGSQRFSAWNGMNGQNTPLAVRNHRTD